jgi:hypothetical protein
VAAGTFSGTLIYGYAPFWICPHQAHEGRENLEPSIMGQREAKGLSLMALAQRAGVDFTEINRIELGNVTSPLATLENWPRPRGVRAGPDREVIQGHPRCR